MIRTFLQQTKKRRQQSDAEVEEFRTLLPTPSEFESGFGWVTIAGLLFCGLIMIPGSIFLGLMTGGNMGEAASWVTVILFMEISRRAMKPLKKQQLVILLHAAQIMMMGSMLFPGGPLAQLVYRAYLVGSDAVRDAGLLGLFPHWFAPSPDSEAILSRDLFHTDWMIPILLMLFTMLVGLVQRYTLGYFFFRLTSDIEGLPFPLAPVNAQGAMALAESEEIAENREDLLKQDEQERKGEGGQEKGKRWRIFSLGAYIGIAFGFVQIGIPAITSIFLAKPIFILPQPFWDTTTMTEGILPATPTGIALDAGLFITGFVLPFWAVMGTAFAVAMTTFANPFLHEAGILTKWEPGMDTVNTFFANKVDFWISFEIGEAIGIAIVSLLATYLGLRKQKKNQQQEHKRKQLSDPWSPPVKGRGDYPLWGAAAVYGLVSAAQVAVAIYLIPFSYTIALFIIIFSFLYNPLISYINARLLGIAGQKVEIPYTKEMAFMFSGVQGIEIWLAPIPIEDYGHQTQAFRISELTGVNFWSLVKTDVVAFPILFVISLLFWSFIWSSDPVPGPLFPNAQVRWDLASKQQVLVMSSTVGETDWQNTELGKAIKPSVMGLGTFLIVGAYAILSFLGMPVMFVYGIVRGSGEFPHMLIAEILGALVAKYYFKRKFGSQNFLRIAPTVLAGYFTGVGLIGMATIAMKLIQNAVSGSLF